MQIVEKYLAAWNEPNADERHARVAATFTPEATYQDPLMQGAGHAAILAGAGQKNCRQERPDLLRNFGL